jgi:hypothetical protein
MEPDKHCYGVRQSGSLVSGPLAVSIHSGPDAFRLRTLFVSIRGSRSFTSIVVQSGGELAIVETVTMRAWST